MKEHVVDKHLKLEESQLQLAFTHRTPNCRRALIPPNPPTNTPKRFSERNPTGTHNENRTDRRSPRRRNTENEANQLKRKANAEQRKRNEFVCVCRLRPERRTDTRRREEHHPAPHAEQELFPISLRSDTHRTQLTR